MLEKLRGAVRPFLARIGAALARLSPDPNLYTLLGGLVAWLTPVAAASRPSLAPLVLAVSAVLDALDGAVARATGRQSRAGEFLDSTLDRLSDIAYFYSLLVLGVSPFPLLVAGMMAVTISYVRAKGELVGVHMRGVGLMERGDRVLMILIIMVAAVTGHTMLADALAWIMVVLSGVTVAHRSVRVLRTLMGRRANR